MAALIRACQPHVHGHLHGVHLLSSGAGVSSGESCSRALDSDRSRLTPCGRLCDRRWSRSGKVTPTADTCDAVSEQTPKMVDCRHRGGRRGGRDRDVFVSGPTGGPGCSGYVAYERRMQGYHREVRGHRLLELAAAISRPVKRLLGRCASLRSRL